MLDILLFLLPGLILFSASCGIGGGNFFLRKHAAAKQQRKFFGGTNVIEVFNAEKIFPAITDNVILFDSVSMYLTNWILTKNLDDENIFSDFEIFINTLIAAAVESCATVIFVSDETGCGIVPENKLARVFRDILGLANQKIAAQAEKVFNGAF